MFKAEIIIDTEVKDAQDEIIKLIKFDKGVG